MVEVGLTAAEKLLAALEPYDVITNFTDDSFVCERMGGSVGYTGNGGGCALFINTDVDGWRESVKATAAHEYNHVVWFQMKGLTHRELTVKDNIALEGLAQCFEEAVTGITPPYATAISSDVARETWDKLAEHLSEPATEWNNKAWFGESDEFETWAGYTLSYMIVSERIVDTKRPWSELMVMSTEELVGDGLGS